MASYALGRAREGWTHLRKNAALPFQRQRGAFDEVLNGDTGEAAGICPDQAWSAAMLVAPVIYGMLGARASAREGRLDLDPHWPSAWPGAKIERIHVGDSVISLTMERIDDRRGPGAVHRHRLQLLAGAPLTVRLGDSRTVTLSIGTRPVAEVILERTSEEDDGGER